MQTAANSIKRHSGSRSANTVRRAARAIVLGTAAALVVLTATWLLTLAWLSAGASVAAPGPASSDELLALGAATVAVSIAAWLCVGAALEVLSHVPGRIGRVAGEWADRVTPALARRAAAFILGVGVGVVGGPSQAVAGPRDSGPAASTSIGSVVDPGFGGLIAPPPAEFAPAPVDPGFTPGPPRVRPQPDPSLLGARPGPTNEHEVVVHRGDSLWSIAAGHLDLDATDAEIASAWPQWFAANRDRIGDDPDLLLPGQVLRIPNLDQTVSVTP